MASKQTTFKMSILRKNKKINKHSLLELKDTKNRKSESKHFMTNEKYGT